MKNKESGRGVITGLVSIGVTGAEQAINIERKSLGVDHEQVDVERLYEVYWQSFIGRLVRDKQCSDGVILMATLGDGQFGNKPQVVSNDLAFLIEMRQNTQPVDAMKRHA